MTPNNSVRVLENSASFIRLKTVFVTVLQGSCFKVHVENRGCEPTGWVMSNLWRVPGSLGTNPLGPRLF